VQVHPHREAERGREVDPGRTLGGRHTLQSRRWHGAIIGAAVLCLLSACTRITQDNFSRIETGMTEQEVISVLGSPTESSSGSLLGISGTASRWIGRDAEINVRFVGGKVATKTYDSPPVTPQK
jgi:hypothetical protein